MNDLLIIAHTISFVKKELENEFGQDLWEEAMGAKLGGKGTTEDLYWWYKKECKQSYTKSELQIRGIL